jgi:putative photosynthetic complex assembly protein
MSAIDLHPFPRWPLIAAGCLIAFAIAGASLVRLARLDQPTPTQTLTERLPAAEAQRTLRFTLQGDESLRIVDINSGVEVAHLQPDESGFIHGAMRGLRRTRKVHSAPSDPQLTIARWSDGRLTASDPETDTLIDLTAFGRDNRAAFEALLAPSVGQTQRQSP